MGSPGHPASPSQVQPIVQQITSAMNSASDAIGQQPPYTGDMDGEDAAVLQGLAQTVSTLVGVRFLRQGSILS
jgi:hypothetical protein